MTKRTEKQMFELFDRAMEKFRGDSGELARTIGQYVIARRMGWKVFLLMTDKRTVKKMEERLGIDFREEFPEVGDLAHRSIAWKAVGAVTNFWKAVKGEIPGIRSPDLK
jgi:hypothetical protein